MYGGRDNVLLLFSGAETVPQRALAAHGLTQLYRSSVQADRNDSQNAL